MISTGIVRRTHGVDSSHSPLRAVLWIALLPSMLANMAGWMARPHVTSAEEGTAEPTTWVFRWFARLAALAVTVNTVVLITMLSLDTFAFQCLGQQQCRGQLWGVLNLLPYESPGIRLAWGIVPPVVVAGLIYLLSFVSRNRYERIEPPTPTATRPVDVADGRCAAAQAGGLRNAGFWSGRRWHLHLSRLHVAVGLAVIAGILGWCVSELGAVVNLQTDWTVLVARSITLASVVIVLVVLGMLVWDDAHETVALATLVITAVVLCTAIFAAWMLPLELTNPGTAPPAVAQPVGVLPGIELSVYAGLMLIGLLLVPLVCQQVAAWGSRRRKAKTVKKEPRAGGTPKMFPFAAPVIMNVVALVLANAVLLSLIVLGAEGLGVVKYGTGPDAEPVTSPVLWVLKPVVSVAAALTAGLGGLVVLFGVAMCIWLRTKSRKIAPELMETMKNDYAKDGGSGAAYVPAASREGQGRKEAWTQSAFDAEPFGASLPVSDTPLVTAESTAASPESESGAAASKWVRKTALMRLVAQHTPDLAAIFLISAAVVGLIASLIAIILGWYPDPWLVELVTWLSVISPIAYAAAVRIMFTQEHMRKALMTPFDVGTFFPRSFHPFAPPSYTERAVPELTRRIWFLHDHSGRVVLTAHSQGSVIAAAVLARKSELQERNVVGLLSLGSPLTKLYRWAFPALLSNGLLKGFAEGHGGFGRVHWSNVHYKTDYIGGPVATDGWQTTRDIDVCLLDPPTHWYVFGQPLPHILSHTGYWVDDRFWRKVNTMCNEVNTMCTGTAHSAAPVAEAQVEVSASVATIALPSTNGKVPNAPDPTVPVPYL